MVSSPGAASDANKLSRCQSNWSTSSPEGHSNRAGSTARTACRSEPTSYRVSPNPRRPENVACWHHTMSCVAKYVCSQTHMSVHMLHTVSIRSYVSPVPRPVQTYMPHTKSILIFWISDGGWTKFCQLKTIRGIVEIIPVFARYATLAPPLPPRFNVDWQNIFPVEPSLDAVYSTLKSGGGRGGNEDA